MSTTIEIDRDSGFVEIDYSEYLIELGTSAVQVAPSAEFTTRAGESVTANDDIKITIDGTTRFDGVAAGGGEKQLNGQTKVAVDHPAAALFAEQVDVTLTGTVTAQDVLSTALSNATRGANFTLNYSGSDTTLNSDYDVSDRPLTQIFRDMMDRTSRVWWVEPAGTTINVQPKGDRGLWQSFNATDDGTPVQSFNPGSVGSVKNAVTVTATGGQAVSATAEDSTSISTYGRRADSVNIKYAATQSEAQSYADELLIPDPLASGSILVPDTAGTIAAPQVNKTLDITDDGKDISATGLNIQRQRIRESRAEFGVGEGTGVSLESVNRRSKSQQDKSAPGSVFDGSNLADGSVDTAQLVDTAVIESKLADLAVTLDKVDADAIDETKITDNAVTTPKVATDAITANEIDAGTITAVEIASRTIAALNIRSDELTANEIAVGTITATEIDADTITANEIDTLDLDANQLSITDSGTGEGIKFTTINALGTTFAAMEPTSAGISRIGSNSNPFNTLDGEIVRSTTSFLGDGNQAAAFFPNDTTPGVEVIDSGGVAIRPTEDNQVESGDALLAWSDVYAHNFVTASPDRIADVSSEEIQNVDWYESPPAPVEQRARSIGETENAIPDGRDHMPVELGTMTNWILEACKSQQEHIELLERRLSKLEERSDSSGQ